MMPEKQYEVTVSGLWANLLSLALFFVFLVVLLTLYFAMWGDREIVYNLPALLGFVAGIGVGLVAHELVHALGWKLAGGLTWKQIRFGFFWRYLAPYAHATVPMPVQAYRLGVVLPGILTGLLPALLGLALGSYWLTLISVVLLSGASGDWLVLWAIRSVPPDAHLLDHPSKIGCVVLLEDLKADRQV